MENKNDAGAASFADTQVRIIGSLKSNAKLGFNSAWFNWGPSEVNRAAVEDLVSKGLIEILEAGTYGPHGYAKQRIALTAGKVAK